MRAKSALKKKIKNWRIQTFESSTVEGQTFSTSLWAMFQGVVIDSVNVCSKSIGLFNCKGVFEL